jgi:hypothetical protein
MPVLIQLQHGKQSPPSSDPVPWKLGRHVARSTHGQPVSTAGSGSECNSHVVGHMVGQHAVQIAHSVIDRIGRYAMGNIPSTFGSDRPPMRVIDWGSPW